MEVIIDEDTGSVYVKRQQTPPGVEPQPTHGYRKFGVTMVWDGHGNLLGIEFASDVALPATVRTVNGEGIRQRQGVTSSA